jgi:5'(3')-deoxyribonucleotidase
MRIMIDLDGCLYNWVESLRQEVFLNAIRDMPEPTKWEFWDEWGLTYEEFKAVFTLGVNAGRIFARGEPAQGGVVVLQSLRQDGHTIHIVSNRSIGSRSLTNTAGWIREWGVPYDTFTLAADKTIIKTDIAIDDCTDNLIALRKAGTRAICFDHPWNQDWNGERVSTWMEFYKLVKDAE